MFKKIICILGVLGVVGLAFMGNHSFASLEHLITNSVSVAVLGIEVDTTEIDWGSTRAYTGVEGEAGDITVPDIHITSLYDTPMALSLKVTNPTNGTTVWIVSNEPFGEDVIELVSYYNGATGANVHSPADTYKLLNGEGIIEGGETNPLTFRTLFPTSISDPSGVYSWSYTIMCADI